MSGFEIKAPPYFYPDGEGGMRLRFQGPDGQLWFYQLTEDFAHQCNTVAALHLKKLAHQRRHPERARDVMEPVR